MSDPCWNIDPQTGQITGIFRPCKKGIQLRNRIRDVVAELGGKLIIEAPVWHSHEWLKQRVMLIVRGRKLQALTNLGDREVDLVQQSPTESFNAQMKAIFRTLREGE